MPKRILQSIYFCILLVGASSCVPNKEFIYLQDKSASSVKYNDGFIQLQRVEYRIQTNDILFISIRSADMAATALFSAAGNAAGGMNIGMGGGGGGMAGGGGGGGGNAFYIEGYSLDADGKVKLPIIGNLPVLGLTVAEVKTLVEKEADKYFNTYFVVVKLSGINFTLVGELTGPGNRVIFQNQVNIFEALASGGGTSPIANKNNIQLIRQYPQGVQVHNLDLTDRNIINSPYYFVQPNDIIYVRPRRSRVISPASNAFETFNLVIGGLGGLASIVTTITLLRKVEFQ